MYKPPGDGPFPAFLFNHGSAPGSLNDQAFEQIGPVFQSRGWVFFTPYRRGQGLSQAAGPFIGDEIARGQRASDLRILPVVAACTLVLVALSVFGLRRRRTWVRAASVVALAAGGASVAWAAHVRAGAEAMVSALETGHLDDHVAAREWLEAQPFVDPDRIATGGNSFGGVVTVLAAERAPYCAAVDLSGGAESWSAAARLRSRMTEAVRHAQAPILFVQAENDYSLAPSRTLSAAMTRAGKPNALAVYPPWGTSAADGHRFAWQGSAVWAPDAFRFLEIHCSDR